MALHYIRRMTHTAPDKEAMSIRISADLKKRLLDATEIGPYRLTMTSLIERGIELALKEMREMQLRKSK